METPKPVLLIDLSALFRAAWHANADGPTSIAFEATLGAVRRCQQQVPDALTAICCDGRGNWRKELSPEYKAHREKQPEAMYGLLDRVKARLIDDGYLLWTADGYEADDLLAGATAKARAAGHDVVIASHDKDVAQLIDEHVSMLKTSTWEFIGPAEVEAKFGVKPAQMGDFLALVGDASDGVKGIPSVGQKTASTLLKLHGSLVKLFMRVNALQTFDSPEGPFCESKTDAARAIGTPAVVEKLYKHRADAVLARELVTLKLDAPINFDDIYQERKVTTKTNSSNTNLDDDGGIISGPPESADPKASPSTGQAEASTPSASTNGPSEPSPDAPSAVEKGQSTTQAAPATPTETALVVAQNVTYEHALEPRTGQQALTLGEVLYESRAYTRFPTPQAITATVMRGRELGITALASLDAFHFVADLGRILPSWQVIVTLAEQSPDCEWFRWVKGDDKSQTWATKHRKHPTQTEFTYRIDQAERAGLIKTDKPKSAWMARPDEMLRKTAACQLARAVYPGATLGLYAPEEMGHES